MKHGYGFSGVASADAKKCRFCTGYPTKALEALTKILPHPVYAFGITSYLFLADSLLDKERVVACDRVRSLSGSIFVRGS